MGYAFDGQKLFTTGSASASKLAIGAIGLRGSADPVAVAVEYLHAGGAGPASHNRHVRCAVGDLTVDGGCESTQHRHVLQCTVLVLQPTAGESIQAHFGSALAAPAAHVHCYEPPAVVRRWYPLGWGR